MRWLWPLLACAARVEALATRRGALQQIAVATQTQYLGVATSQTQGRGPRPQTAVAGPVAALPPLVVVLGAGGRTGRAIVEACVERGLRVKAATRGISAASQAFKFQGDLVSPTQCDVASRPALDAAVSGASLVVFAATASAFGDPKAVDEFGVRNAAEACIAASVKRFLLVSGAGVTHNESQVSATRDTGGAQRRGAEAGRRGEAVQSPNGFGLKTCGTGLPGLRVLVDPSLSGSDRGTNPTLGRRVVWQTCDPFRVHTGQISNPGTPPLPPPPGVRQYGPLQGLFRGHVHGLCTVTYLLRGLFQGPFLRTSTASFAATLCAVACKGSLALEEPGRTGPSARPLSRPRPLHGRLRGLFQGPYQASTQGSL
ncbi:hypothetical protein M885DRAFT_341760 [Pelagophyceae sp. CCMP2097]|nr:hypothetical protein M885DRAFT_341760 [Pelagophyceae sp. CCMP2097]